MRIFVVSSCRLDISTGNVSTLVLRGFTEPEAADAWIKEQEKRDPSFNPEEDWYEIDDVTLY
jgi:hypothetical protein